MLNTFIIFMFLVIGGVLLEVLISQAHYYLTKKHFKKYHFSFSRYFFLLLFPLIAATLVALQVGPTLFKIFFAFAIIGMFFEALIGFSYHMVVGQRLWTYHRYGLNGYTSLLSIPLWGLAGALFFLLTKVFIY